MRKCCWFDIAVAQDLNTAVQQEQSTEAQTICLFLFLSLIVCVSPSLSLSFRSTGLHE